MAEMGKSSGSGNSGLLVAGQVTALTIIWWSSSMVVVLWIKKVLSPVNDHAPVFPYPFFFSGILNLCVAGWSLLGGRLLSTFSAQATTERVPLLPRELRFLIFMGCLQGAELALANKSYQFLSVAMNRMVMACTVIFQLFTAIIWRLEEIRCVKWLAAGVLVIGALIVNLDCTDQDSAWKSALCGPHSGGWKDKTENSWIGWLLVITSVIISANRWAVTQHIFQRSSHDSAFRRWTKAQMIPYMSIGTTSMCFLLAGIFEHHAWGEVTHKHVVSIIIPALIVSLCIATLTMSELLIVSMTAATVMVILAVVNNIPIVLAGIVLYHDEVFRNQWIGFCLCSMGAATYFYARGQDKHIDEVGTLLSSREIMSSRESKTPRGDQEVAVPFE
jgi:drug/metabolite transporter (DMT)-like permease